MGEAWLANGKPQHARVQVGSPDARRRGAPELQFGMRDVARLGVGDEERRHRFGDRGVLAPGDRGLAALRRAHGSRTIIVSLDMGLAGASLYKRSPAS